MTPVTVYYKLATGFTPNGSYLEVSQPASRFWAFQGIEAGIYVVLAAALLAVTFWALKRWDA
jgi:hypothetical protein